MLVSGEEDCIIGNGLLTYSMAELLNFPHVYPFLLQHEFIPSARPNLEEELCLHGPVTYQMTVQEQKGGARSSVGDAMTSSIGQVFLQASGGKCLTPTQ